MGSVIGLVRFSTRSYLCGSELGLLALFGIFEKAKLAVTNKC